MNKRNEKWIRKRGKYIFVTLENLQHKILTKSKTHTHTRAHKKEKHKEKRIVVSSYLTSASLSAFLCASYSLLNYFRIFFLYGDNARYNSFSNIIHMVTHWKLNWLLLDLCGFLRIFSFFFKYINSTHSHL